MRARRFEEGEGGRISKRYVVSKNKKREDRQLSGRKGDTLKLFCPKSSVVAFFERELGDFGARKALV